MRAVRQRRRGRGQGAQSMLEFALIAPVLLVLVVGAAQLGAILYAGVSVASAAHDAATVASEQPKNSKAYVDSGLTVAVGPGATCPSLGNPVCAAVAQSQGLLTMAATTISPGSAVGTGSGCATNSVPDGYVTVTVSDDVPIFVPFLNNLLANSAGGSVRTISTTVTMRVEPCAMTVVTDGP